MDRVSLLRRYASALGVARSWQALLAGALLVGLLAVAIHLVVDLRRSAWRQADAAAENLSGALRKEIGRTIALYDLSLGGVVSGLADPEFAQLSPAIRQRVLFDRAAEARHLGVILVADATGAVIYSSAPVRAGLNLRDRPFFRERRAGSDSGLHVGSAIASVVAPGEFMVPLSRRLSYPDGRFAGVVVGAIRFSFFADLFASLNLGPHGVVALLDDEGVIVGRWPSLPASGPMTMAVSPNLRRFLGGDRGSFVGTATTDGVRRLYVFRRVDAYSLIVNVGVAVEDITAAWVRHAISIGGLMLALCGIAVALILSHQRELRKRLASERRQAALAADYRLLSDNTADMITRFDSGFRRVFVSPACERLLGYTQDELVGELPGGIVHPEHWPELDAALNAPLRAGAQHARASFLAVRKDGGTLWLESAGRPLPDGSGYVVVTRDVSDRVEIEERLMQANAQLACLADLDGLTRLLNRRAFDEALEREYLRCAAAGASIGLILLDVDWFKVFNDRYGHPEGDSCLRRVAQTVRLSAGGAADLAARYGGEELAVILPEADLLQALMVAEEIRLAIAAARIRHEASPLGHVTVSVGVSSMIAALDRNGCERLVQSADQALYRAKSWGRNRVITSAFDTPNLEFHREPMRSTG